MYFLITGCYGFIGKKLTNHLLNLGYKVIGLDVFNDESIQNKNFTFYYFDFPNCFDILNDKKIYTIFHFSWCGVSTSDKNDLEKQIKNFEITFNVLQLAKITNTKRIVIPGSISEFSKCKNAVTGTEKDSPADMYAATKVGIRKISYEFCIKNNICLNWLLITSVYGGSRKDNNLLTQTICNLLNNKVVETTRLEQKWDYIYIDDLINALVIIGLKGRKNVIYPIGSGRVQNLSYYVNFIAKLLKKEHLLQIGKLEYKNKYVDNSIVNVSKIQKLGFKCHKPFEENIIEVIDYYKEVNKHNE